MNKKILVFDEFQKVLKTCFESKRGVTPVTLFKPDRIDQNSIQRRALFREKKYHALKPLYLNPLEKSNDFDVIF